MRSYILTFPLFFLITATLSLAGAEPNWQQSQAKVLPEGNLEWAPRPFEFETSGPVRYIDFEGGNDNNSGESFEQPWQHHPWDREAEGKSKTFEGPATYVFKGGVVYRGKMYADDSGEADSPIRLTTDPAWGSGPARIYGSRQITEQWHRGNAETAPRIPEPEKVWFVDLPEDFDIIDHRPDRSDGAHAISTLHLVRRDGSIQRLDLARDPDKSQEDPLYPYRSWHHWQVFEGALNTGWLIDPQWQGKPVEMFEGGRFITQHRYLMGSPHAQEIEQGEFDPEKGAFKVNSGGGARFRGNYNFDEPYQLEEGRVGYFFERIPEFLDAPYEYFFQWQGPLKNRLYVRLAEGESPADVEFEVGVLRAPVEIRDQNHIVISGIDFAFNDTHDGTYGYPPQIGASPMVRIIGNCTDITVKNCRFYYVSQAVTAFPRPESGESGPPSVYQKEIGDFRDDVMSDIVVQDNDIRYSEGEATIWITGSSESTRGKPFGKLRDAKVLRNQVLDSGFGSTGGPTSAISAIRVIDGEVTEVAGNIVHRSWGNGIFVNGGKQGRHRSGFNEVPLIRNLIYQNDVRDTMLMCSDYGGINFYQGGPTYMYNNVIHNAIGTRTFTGGELGYNLYIDGGFKAYSFNNIITGRFDPDNPDYYNHCGYFMVFGFLNHFWNNTIYRFEYAVNGSSGNRSAILSNVMVEMQNTFLGQNRAGDVSMMGGGDTGAEGRKGIPTMSYSNNVFYGDPEGPKWGGGKFGFVGGIGSAGKKAEVYRGDTLEELSSALTEMKARLSSIGVHTQADPLQEPAAQDYRPEPGSAAIDKGSRVFVPWALARVVGEWHFHKSQDHPETVLGENFYLTREHIVRNGYYMFPRNDLEVNQVSAEDYVLSPFEDWIDSALVFDGKTRFAKLEHAAMTREVTYPFSVNDSNQSVEGGEMTISGEDRPTLDMGTNNFLIELIFRADQGAAPGTVLAKADTQGGYALGITEAGQVVVELKSGSAASTLTGPAVADGQWHHLIAEIDRENSRVRFYLDGEPGMEETLQLAGDASLANTADFLVGKDPEENYFSGAIDFLRVSRGTLAEARTTIAELYAWQFQGPFLRDFLGQPPTGKRRDAGALEGAGK